MTRFVPAHLRPTAHLVAAIFAFVGALVWAFRYDAAHAAGDRQTAIVTLAILVVAGWVNLALWARGEREPKPSRPETFTTQFVAPALAGVVLASASVFGYVTAVTAAPVENPAHQPILVFSGAGSGSTTGVSTMPVAPQMGTGVYPVALPG